MRALPSTTYRVVSSRATPLVIVSMLTCMVASTGLAEAINKSFAPTAEYNTEHGRYYTNCDATPPSFSVMIGGSNFIVNPADMIIRDKPDPHTLLCPTTISLGGTGPYILGAAFLNNVAVGFDVQAAELKFVSRPFY